MRSPIALALIVFVLRNLAISSQAATRFGMVERFIDGDTIVFKAIGAKTLKAREALDIRSMTLDLDIRVGTFGGMKRKII